MSHHDLEDDADASAEDHLLTAEDGDAKGNNDEVPQNGHDLDDDGELDDGEDDDG